MKARRSKYHRVKKTYRFPGDFVIHTYPAGQDGCLFRPESSTYILFICPCNVCGWEVILPINTGVKKEGAWLWDGNIESPTLTPSIRRLNDCTYHGYMTAGKWNWCADGVPPSDECKNRGKQV